MWTKKIAKHQDKYRLTEEKLVAPEPNQTKRERCRHCTRSFERNVNIRCLLCKEL